MDIVATLHPFLNMVVVYTVSAIVSPAETETNTTLSPQRIASSLPSTR